MDCKDHKNELLAECPKCLALYWESKCDQLRKQLAEVEAEIDEIHATGGTSYKRLQQVERERDELKEHRMMEMAAISVASSANTIDSATKQRIDASHAYWSPAYHDVCVAVDREMRERKRAEKAEADLAEVEFQKQDNHDRAEEIISAREADIKRLHSELVECEICAILQREVSPEYLCKSCASNKLDRVADLLERGASMFEKYRRTNIAEMRPYVSGEDLTEISVSTVDDPESDMGMVARNPMNHKDQWYVARQYFEDNFEPVEISGAVPLSKTIGAIVLLMALGAVVALLFQMMLWMPI